MGDNKSLLKEVYDLMVETGSILKKEFDYDGDMQNISINEKEEYITVGDNSGKCYQYDITDSYTALIKIAKLYKNEKIMKNYKRLRDISLERELYFS